MDEPAAKRKCFNDPVHKHIELHPLLVKFINTPQFQRLKNIKQLGGNYFLYPGASHNRFEHSIGTCHLAGELVRHLQSRQPELKIDDKDVLCVELAGLCHDLGHGPFSHMFDHHFMEKNGKPEKKKYFEHEERSCLMFDRILQDKNNKNVESKFKDLLFTYDGRDKSDVTKWRNAIFIKEMINGPRDDSMDDGDERSEVWKYEGRPREKSFLYEIVSNKRNGVDVDKWDYFARDCHQLGIANSFDHIRFMRNMKVLKRTQTDDSDQDVGNDYDLQICCRDKECKNLYEMYHTRAALHRRAYQHRISTAVEAMICDAMVLANDYIKFKGESGEQTMADSVDDMAAFEQITDNVIDQIRYSSVAGTASDDERNAMKKAKDILRRVFKHDYYTYIGTKKAPENVVATFDEVKKWKNEEKDSFERIFEVLKEDRVYREKTFDYGRKDQNPVDRFLFYSKEEPNNPKQIKREEVSHLLPKQFMDVELEVYCKSLEKKKVDEFRGKFEEWKDEKH